MSTELRGLRTLIYPTTDLDADKSWWTTYLGFGPYFDEPFYVGFDVAGYELGLVPTEESGASPTTYWGVDDVAQAVADAEASGAILLEAPQDVGDGIIVASVAEPERTRHRTHLQSSLRREVVTPEAPYVLATELLARENLFVHDDEDPVRAVRPRPKRVTDLTEFFTRGEAVLESLSRELAVEHAVSPQVGPPLTLLDGLVGPLRRRRLQRREAGRFDPTGEEPSRRRLRRRCVALSGGRAPSTDRALHWVATT